MDVYAGWVADLYGYGCYLGRGGRDRCRRRWRCGMSVLERGWGIVKSGGIGRFEDRFVWNRNMLLGGSS